ncbi:MAG: quinone-dependent dihydroorotate dehydrogenase [Candidatus Saccharimonas sp.]
MNLIRRVTAWGYRHVAKPIMFRHKPDAVHSALIGSARRVQKLPGIRALPKLWSYQHEMLHTEVAGISFRNPVGLSAGFDKTIEMPPLMKSVGFGWVTGGSVTYGSYAGNDKPWFHRLPNSKSLVVNAGLPSEGTPIVAERTKLYPRHLFAGFPLNVSVAKTNSKESVGDEAGVKDYCESLAIFDTISQVSMLEINISCPNTFGGEPFTTSPRLEKLLKAVDELGLGKPVFIKMPINLPMDEFDSLLKVISRHHVTGVTIGNLMKDRKKVKLQDKLPDDVKGNLSGRPAKDITTDLVRRTHRKYSDKLVIIGVGGIMSAEDAYEKIQAGASLVALITGLIYEGPQLVGDINRGLVKLLKRDGFSSVAEAVGSETTK